MTGPPGVAPFVRLKLRLLANGLRGRPARIALFVAGAVLSGIFAISGYAIFAIPGVAQRPGAAAILLPLGGAAIVLGWLFLPLVFFGVDESLDPARFALLPLRRSTLIRGLSAAALVGLPALATLVAMGGMVETAGSLGGVGAALGELAGVLCGLLLCVSLSRAVTSAFATGLRSRRSRDLATIVLAMFAAAIGPLQLAVLAGAQRADWAKVRAVAEVVGWTPLGAPYGIGLEIAAGRWWAAPLKLLITLAAIGGLLRWWSSTLENAMIGTVAAGRRGTTASRNPVDLLLLPRMPGTRFGALVSREVRYWWRETRRRAGLITFTMAGLFLPISVTISDGSPGAMVVFVGALAALGLVNQFGFDSSAYATNLAAGIPGRVEIGSRAAAHAVYTLPLLVVVSTVVGALAGNPGRIPSTFGLLIAAYGVGLGLVLPVSVRAAYAFPASSNPFAMSSGGGPAKGLLAISVLLGAIVVSLPLQVVALVLGPVWLWIGLPVGVAYGTAAYLIGANIAADLLDKRAPELLAAVTPNR
ncbi:ABC transporter permease [Actinoplanes sp. KI2]|uniref:ABC transporter permease n=1 Tax=Actinoplanes sp. KI2 TaxID=2983315 RepID=UPI0021D593FB|nr:ABC transporter permease [Actinoplanes sp. KI2]MCU7722197.1 ABC transporter permease [Actinoplanes sp. KI2]